MFLDSVEDGSDPKSLTNLHNNEAGRVVSQKYDPFSSFLLFSCIYVLLLIETDLH